MEIKTGTGKHSRGLTASNVVAFNDVRTKPSLPVIESPAPEPDYGTVARCLMMAANYQDADDEKAALDCYKEALRLDPNCAEALLKAGIIHINMDQDEEALNYLERAYAIDP